MFFDTQAAKLIYRVAQVRSTNPTKPSLNCVSVEPNERGSASIASTDGFILAFAGNVQAEDPVNALIPPALLKLIKPAHFDRPNGPTIAFDAAAQQWTYQYNGTSTSVPAAQVMPFPRWRKVLPNADATFEDRPERFETKYLLLADAALSDDPKYPVCFALHCLMNGNKAVATCDGVTVVLMAASEVDRCSAATCGSISSVFDATPATEGN